MATLKIISVVLCRLAFARADAGTHEHEHEVSYAERNESCVIFSGGLLRHFRLGSNAQNVKYRVCRLTVLELKPCEDLVKI